MQVLFVRDGGDPAGQEVDLRLGDPDATVADVVEAVTAADVPPELVVRVDGRQVDLDLGLAEAGVVHGSEIRLGRPAAAPVRAGPVLVGVVGGLDAGLSVSVGAGPVLLGRTGGPPSAGGMDQAEGPAVLPLTCPTASRSQARLQISRGGVAVADLGSSNGSWLHGRRLTDEPVPLQLGDVVRCGYSGVRVAAEPEDDRPRGLDPLRQVTAAGTLTFNRPPRPAAPAAPVPLAVPVPPTTTDKPYFSVAQLLAPLGFAVVMVVALHNPLFALFAALSPVMVVANYIEQRRRTARTRARAGSEYAAALETFTAAVARLHTGEVARRREATPDPVEVRRRASTPSVRLWERRRLSADLLRLSVGAGEPVWTPPLAEPADARGIPVGAPGNERPPEVAQVLSRWGRLPEVPVTVDLSDGGVVGLAGPRTACLAIARWLVAQAAVQSGPADLRLAVLADADRGGDWDWTKWLPHARDLDNGGEARFLAAGDPACEALLTRLAADAPTDPKDGTDPGAGGPVILAVLDHRSLLEGRGAPGRALLRGAMGPVAGIVLAETPDRLPAVCTTVVTVSDPDGLATVARMDVAGAGEPVHATGLSDATARALARDLARLDDPELHVAGAGLPDRLNLLPLLGLATGDPDEMAATLLQRWGSAGLDPGAAGPVGRTESGPFVLDLVRDGPHALMGGTTGSGKSELLRTLVATLATTADPDHLTFVLVDYKGGSAFDVAAALPHTVGLVTDLDFSLGERALRCLEAELKHRERTLRAAGAGDLPAYLAQQRPGGATEPREPMPRLVVVVDEFATLAAELPDFMTALVGIAQRGRSLGVHMLLATQRPSGAVNENIRANTNLRVALRVQSTADSTDVVDAPDAALIPRGRAGRGYVRLGPGELVALQSALVTGHSIGGAGRRVSPAPFVFGPRVRPPDPVRAAPEGPSDLHRLVDAARAAFDRTGRPAPRRPWPEPLPAVLPLAELDAATVVRASLGGAAEPGTVVLGLADDPDRQTQYPVGWRPAEGNLLLYGMPGSGTTTTLQTLALQLAADRSPEQLHLHVLDAGAGELAVLASLPQAGSVVGPTETERRDRLLLWLRDELARRREASLPERDRLPELVLLVDGWGSLAAGLDTPDGADLLDSLTRVFADGPEVGMRMVVSADRAGAVPTALAALAGQKLLFRFADPYEYASFGLRAQAVGALPPGGAVRAADGLRVQVACPPDDLVAAVTALAERWDAGTGGAHVVGTLPAQVSLSTLLGAAEAGPPWRLPVGVADRDLGPAVLSLYEGEHLTVAGPPRSGRSTTLLTLVAAARAAVPDLQVVPIALRRSPVQQLAGCARTPDEAVAALQPLLGRTGPRLVVIDDGDVLDDPGGLLATLLAARDPQLHLALAGRPDVLRTSYGHWTAEARRSRVGVLLRPDVDLDGDLLGARLPRRARVPMTPGRGYLVGDGEVALAQLALPEAIFTAR